MYFFVGRPQAWAAYLEISSIDGTDMFAPGDGVLSVLLVQVLHLKQQLQKF